MTYGDHPFLDPKNSRRHEGLPPDAYVNPYDYADESQWLAVNGAVREDALRRATAPASLAGGRKDLPRRYFLTIDNLDHRNPEGTRRRWHQAIDHYLTFNNDLLTEAQELELANNLAALDAEFLEQRTQDVRRLTHSLTPKYREKLLSFVIGESDSAAWEGLVASLPHYVMPFA